MSGRSSGLARRGTVAAGVIVGGLLLWAASGIRTIDRSTHFGVYAPRFGGAPRVVEGPFALALPGLATWSRWPREPSTLALPNARRAMLPGQNGSRFGLRGRAVLRALPEHPRELASSKNLDAVLLDAVLASGPVLAAAEVGHAAIPSASLTVQDRLRKALAERGVALESLELLGFDYLVANSDVAPLAEGVNVLLVGLDGADWEIVDPLLESGRMPNLARLVREGVHAKFLSITPMLSPVIWTSIATGVEPARHGVLDFLVPGPDGTSQPVTSHERAVPAVWELLSEAGAPVGVTGWWATWPADPVKGFMVTDRVSYQLFGFASDPRSADGKTWPPELYDEVRRRIVAPGDVPWSEVVPYLDGARRTPEAFTSSERELLDEFRTVLASGKTYLEVALALRAKTPLRFEAVYFEGTDTVGHLFMPYRAPRLPAIDASRFASFHDVVDRYYETADRMLGRLLEGRDDWIVIVCSDHGFASDATRPRTTDSRIGHGAAADWHRRFGVFVMRGPGIRKGTTIQEVSVYDVAPTVLALFGQPVPASWPGRVIGEAIAPERIAAHPVRFRGDPVRRGATEVPGDGNAEANELREKLESLGYVAGSAPTPMTTKNNRGVAYLADGKFEEAAEAFRQAIHDEPTQTTLWVNLGIALRFAGKRDEARTWLEKARARPESQRAAGHQLAQLELEAGRFDAAERELRSVLAREPGAAEVHNSLGLVLEKQGRRSDAAKSYEEAARLDPNAAEPRNNLGNLAKESGQPEQAELWYRAAIEADPYFMGAYNNLALIYQDRGQLDLAIDLYDRALTKAPTNAVVLNNLASLYFAKGENAAARATWRRAADADPKYASPLNNLAGLALAEGDDVAAEELLARALKLDPNYGDAHTNLSLVARKRGDTVAARRELRLAARDPRAEGQAMMQLGFLELEAGNARAAIQALEAAHRPLGDRTELLNALGESYARAGERGKAIEAWRRSLSRDPKQVRLEELIKELEQK